jgi:multiple sugar transport system ATP-binding protein
VGSTQMNFLPASAVPSALQGKANGHNLTIGIRPENLRIVAPSAPEATIKGSVSLVEPLGAKDVVHLAVDGQDLRAIATPGERRRIGENVGLVFDPERMHFFDDETGRVVK